ncbi:hypothetical protein EKH57_17475 (plasmid) [Halorubrum sp. BOL3-1]|uniref:PD-(D/E)XK nuclease family protein n=1 Tax=Halorubrum sp. BOL3-1 TaxID=2497325 RepID=UPI001005031E|nr:PD-(D/E)XK nuclease family protein [Halorubrum sp. BOL3-1]QAU14475.1 hypothetical protein EKH57_17475 [Halorubrum sp. BOL3-1]
MERQLADVNRPPATTLEIIGETKRERYWEDLLVYFLIPDEPHGFGTDVMSAFLKALSEHGGTSFSPRRHNLEQVEVESQVPTSNGPFDILLWNEDEWYIVIELKVSATETGSQTKRYAQASKLGDLRVTPYEGDKEYVYLTPRSTASSTSERFDDVSWEHIIPYFEEVLTTGHGHYPLKSHAQFADYLDTIRQTLNMDDFTTISKETKLYTEYAETIDRLVEAYESDKAEIFNQLQTTFFNELAGSKEEWSINNRPSRYINFAKKGWGNVAGSVQIEYEPHVHLDREHPEIRLRLDIEGTGKSQIRNELHETLNQADRDTLEKADWEVVDGGYAYLAKSVPLDIDDPAASIRHAINDLNQLRETVEPCIDEIVADHQHTTD